MVAVKWQKQRIYFTYFPCSRYYLVMHLRISKKRTSRFPICLCAHLSLLPSLKSQPILHIGYNGEDTKVQMPIKKLLAYPGTHELDIDSPETTLFRRQIILEKKFLKQIYVEWYQTLSAQLPDLTGSILEIGSGGGFLPEIIPDVITSEVFYLPDMDMLLNGHDLPFPSESLKAILMSNVFHHIPDVERFISESLRCLKPGGRIIMLEPWVSNWSTFIYRRLHHEPFEPDSDSWSFPTSGPLSGANGALPWIVFQRDQERLLHLFPQLKVVSIQGTMPFRYLISGGVSLRSLIPAWSFGFWRRFETMLSPWKKQISMFAYITLEKVKK